jgi:hypothetical protein
MCKASARQRLAVRFVAEPALSPVRNQVHEGITAFDPTMVTAQSSPTEPAKVQVTPEAEVRLRISSAGAQVVMNGEVIVLLDGQVIGIGSVRTGFDVQGETTTGFHELQLRWAVLTETFEVAFPTAGCYEAEFFWSWFWGKYLCRNPEE